MTLGAAFRYDCCKDAPAPNDTNIASIYGTLAALRMAGRRFFQEARRPDESPAASIYLRTVSKLRKGKRE